MSLINGTQFMNQNNKDNTITLNDLITTLNKNKEANQFNQNSNNTH